jgi:hypothetical protein
MMTPRLAILGLLIAQAAAPLTLVVPDAPDVMVKTRRTTIDRPGSPVVTEILYLKGARQRRDSFREDSFPPPQAATRSGVSRRPEWINISQCDERRTLTLNREARTYAYEPIEDPAAIVARLAADNKRQPPSPQMTVSRAITFTIDAVDTGERRQFGHYVARHVITTRTLEPGPGSEEEARTDRQDGWYIDAPEMDCWASERETALFVGLMRSEAPVPHVQFKQRGTARRGYPIEETYRIGGKYASVSKVELIELSEAPLDDALFTVPSGYRAALPRPYGGYDLTKPDTLMNRLESYREVAAAWADYIKRHGLLGILPGTQPPARY